MNILDNIRSVIKGERTDDELTAEELELQAKKDRIEFHRRSVRNGPVNFKTPTNGQVRRAERRAMQRRIKANQRKQVRTYFANQREGAVLRAHLDSVGVLPLLLDCPRPTPPNPVSAYNSTIWLIKHFADRSQVDEQGRVPVTEKSVREAFRVALNRWQKIVGLPPTELPEGYELPVQAAA